MIRESRPQKQPDQLDGAPIWRRLAELGPELGGDWRPVHGGGPQFDAPPEPAAFGEAEILEEGGRFRLYDVGPPSESRFTAFLDGIEHTRIAGYVGTVPIVHGYVAAVIRGRSDRAFTTWNLIEEEVLAFPHQLLGPERLVQLGLPEGSLLNSEGDEDTAHPIFLAEKAREAVKLQRALLERRLARRWADEGPRDGWLLVDGRLAIEPGLLRSGRAVGLVKSHRTQFLGMESMEAVLSMEQGRRSSIFKPVRPEVGEVYSWYLRLRPPAGHDIYWALARIEGRADPETLEIADEASR
jgi:hypothetical protein